jgi:hypothetical protein
VPVVGDVPAGLPDFGVPDVSLSGRTVESRADGRLVLVPSARVSWGQFALLLVGAEAIVARQATDPLDAGTADPKAVLGPDQRGATPDR